MVRRYQYDLNSETARMKEEVGNKQARLPLDYIQSEETKTGLILTLNHSCQAVYGLGERFDGVNQKGRTVRTEVMEKFCNQGSTSYCPIPFFVTDRGLGVWIDAVTVTEFEFGKDIRIVLGRDSRGRLPSLSLFAGQPAEILSEYVRITGYPAMVPKWCFTPWMSANRWNTKEEVLRQVALAKQYRFPHGVLVLEAWSDEATFYRFNENGAWESPQEMMQVLEENGIRLVLWQIPVLKKMEHGQHHKVLDEDWEYAIAQGLCIKNADGTPYTIPEGHWFAGSLLPDFTNPETITWWFGKRQYLLELGVSGFKTDGGEFILTDDVTSASGLTGRELRNQYASEYVKAYTEFIGKNRVLFSRAGYMGQQNYPLQWAGDQQSTWEELRHILSAGLSLGLSGVPYWGFDIAGFAGNLPSTELYERATQLAVFAPIMQWHSEPVGGQFAQLYPTAGGNNDRSPWNISSVYECPELLERLRYHYNLRMNLLPYLYCEALRSQELGLPMMKHLILNYPEDPNVVALEDCFMLGDLLIAPVFEEGTLQRRVYLPQGNWMPLWPMRITKEDGSQLLLPKDITKEDGSQPVLPMETTKEDVSLQLRPKEITDRDSVPREQGELLLGQRYYQVTCEVDRIPVFIRCGGCLALNLGASLELGGEVGNQAFGYQNLCFYPVGEEGSYLFRDEAGLEAELIWKSGSYEVKQLSGTQDIHVLDKI